jgi:hypothetical protein
MCSILLKFVFAKLDEMLAVFFVLVSYFVTPAGNT